MAKLTKKSFKRKRLLMGLALFMSVALISTGFAAWVISSSVTKEGDGNVSAGTVSDKSLELEINDADNLGTFKFEPKEEDKSGRVRYDGVEGNCESLSVTVTGKITKNADYLGDLTLQLVEINKDTGQPYAIEDSGLYKAAGKDYITLPECFYKPIKLNADDVDYYDPTTYEFSYTITFGWGSKFYGVNPGYFYDGLDADGNEYAEGEGAEAVAAAALIEDPEMIETLVDIRNVIYNTNETMVEQVENGTTGPQYQVIVKATTN